MARTDSTETITQEPELVQGPDGLSLVGEGMSLQADFRRMLPRLKSGQFRSEMLVKAAKISSFGENPVAVDATAGLGEDSLLLAAAGFTVYMMERDPIIAALLQDGLQRAQADPNLAPVANRMTLLQGDSILQLPALDFEPDLILLDPMFPAKRKDASSKKKMKLFQQLEKPCEDEEELMNAALAAHPRKIVVKRPLKGPFLADAKPSYSLKGKTIRYDCIVLPK